MKDAIHHPPVHHVGAEHGLVVRVGVLLPLPGGHRLPAVVEHVLRRPDPHDGPGGPGGDVDVPEDLSLPPVSLVSAVLVLLDK